MKRYVFGQTYGQGVATELVAAGTNDYYGLPVSTTHVLSSGVAGIMAANGSGLQTSTLRNNALAWVLTLPVAMILSGCLFGCSVICLRTPILARLRNMSLCDRDRIS
jgi:phosphate/sulfate permease